MYKISLSEHEFLTTTRENQLTILAMGREFAANSGVDLEYEYRWMTMTEENYFLARLKYDSILSAMTSRKI